MRILEWAMPYLPVRGGREVFIGRLSRALVDRGHCVSLVAPDVSELDLGAHADEAEPFEVTRIRLGGFFSERDALLPDGAVTSVADVIGDFRPDVIHAHNLGPDLMLLRDAMRRAGVTIPITLTYHLRAQDFDPERRSMARYATGALHSVVTISEFTNGELARRNPLLSDRLVMIRNGVELDATPADPECRQVFAMGRLSAEKGIATLLVAWSILVSTAPGWRLVVAGHGPEMPGLRRLAGHLAIADSVDFPGWLDQDAVAHGIRSSLLTVVPSVWDEPFGLAAAESHALGRAVLASNVGALPEIVDDGQTGFLLPPGDPLSLAGALRRLAGDPSEAVEMGAHAARRAEDVLSWRTCVDRYEEHFGRMVTS